MIVWPWELESFTAPPPPHQKRKLSLLREGLPMHGAASSYFPVTKRQTCGFVLHTISQELLLFVPFIVC